MNSEGITVDDLSQPISESYLHLSRDNLTDLSNSSSIALSDYEAHDTNMLLRLAKHIDEQNQFSGRSKTSSPTEQSPDNNENTVHDDDFSKRSDTDFKRHPNTTEHEKTKVGTFLKFASPPFSSHSTPLVAKKPGYGHSSMKWSKYSRDNFLSDINESRNDETTMNEAKGSSPEAVRPQENDSEPKFTVDELLNDIVPLFNEEIRAKMKDSVLRLIHQTQEQLSKDLDPKRDVFITPIRVNSNNSGNLDYSEEDEDRLSLDRIPFEPRSKSVNPDGSVVNRALPKDVESPTTTPPHSQEYDSKLESIIQDNSPELQKEVERLEKENLDLKIDLNKLQLELIAKNDLPLEDTNLIDITVNSDLYETPKNVKDDMKEKCEAMEKELARTKLKNDELINEFNWYKANHGKVAEKDHEQASHKACQTDAKEHVKRIDSQSLNGKFQEYYQKLHLDQVDQLSPIEASNMIKNLMLSLLISDFENLPVNAKKYGKFIGLSLRFMDAVHKQLYREPTGDIHKDIRPSYYLKNDQGFVDQDLENLQRCLNGMVETLTDI